MTRRTLTLTLGIEVDQHALDALEDWPGSGSTPPCPGWELFADRLADECTRLLFAELLRINANPALVSLGWQLDHTTAPQDTDSVL